MVQESDSRSGLNASWLLRTSQ